MLLGSVIGYTSSIIFYVDRNGMSDTNGPSEAVTATDSTTTEQTHFGFKQVDKTQKASLVANVLTLWPPNTMS